MSTPFVAGVAAYMLNMIKGKVTGKTLCAKIQEVSTKNALKDIMATTQTGNRLLYNGVT
jgi:hypothetical protein